MKRLAWLVYWAARTVEVALVALIIGGGAVLTVALFVRDWPQSFYGSLLGLATVVLFVLAIDAWEWARRELGR